MPLRCRENDVIVMKTIDLAVAREVMSDLDVYRHGSHSGSAVAPENLLAMPKKGLKPETVISPAALDFSSDMTAEQAKDHLLGVARMLRSCPQA